MSSWDGWTDTETETVKWLEQARSRRLEAGKDGNKEIRARMLAAREARDEQRADIISLQLYKRSIAFTRIQRLRQLAEQERDLKRVGAAVRRAVRELERVKNSETAPLFEFDPARTGTKVRDARELYWEWIPRGFSKGEPKNFKKSSKPRIRAREATWEDGEFQDKIVYIERADALEDVPGNLLSNMGEDQAERLGCASRIEELERLSRSNAGVYTHCILALPADLSREGRAAVLKEICDYFARLKLPYCAALHKPDPKNSQKNFHAHILVALRPMERVQDRWEFASTKLTWLSTTAGLKLQRRVVASVFNTALEAEKSSTKFTARSRADDGLAPGGFTKREGVSRPRNIDSDIVDVLNARERVAEAEALEGAIGALERTAERLAACEECLDDLRAALEEQARVADDKSAVDVPQPADGAVNDIATERSIAVDEPVANSQRGPGGPDTDEGREGRSRVIQLETELEPPEDLDIGESPFVQPHFVPFPPAPMTDERRRRQKLRKVRRELENEQDWQQLSGRERQVLERDLDEAIDCLTTGSVVISGDGDMLRISSAKIDDLSAVENVANSQLGWTVLHRMSDEIADLDPKHHSQFEVRPRRPADASPNVGRDKSRER